MKLRIAFVVALACLGLGASLGLGATRDRGDDGDRTTTRTAPACVRVTLGGPATSGSVAFTAARTSENARNLAGKAVTLSVPAGARVLAVACRTNGTLTLRSLRVTVAPPKADDGQDGDRRGRR